MARELTTRQQWVLQYVRENPGKTIKEIGEASPIDEVKSQLRHEQHPTMSRMEWPSVDYPIAQVALQRLRDLGLVRRTPENREPGDPPYAHYAVEGAEPDSDDPLEQAFAAPAHEGAER